MDYSLLGSSVYGIYQARILEQLAISFSRGFSQPRDRTWVFCIGRWILYHWATRETPDEKLRGLYFSCFTLDQWKGKQGWISESHCWRVCVVGCVPHLQPSSRQEEGCHEAAMCIGGPEVQSRKIMFQEILKMHITNSWMYPDPQFVKYCMPTVSLRCIEKTLEIYTAKFHRVFSEMPQALLPWPKRLPRGSNIFHTAPWHGYPALPLQGS